MMHLLHARMRNEAIAVPLLWFLKSKKTEHFTCGSGFSRRRSSVQQVGSKCNLSEIGLLFWDWSLLFESGSTRRNHQRKSWLIHSSTKIRPFQNHHPHNVITESLQECNNGSSSGFWCRTAKKGMTSSLHACIRGNSTLIMDDCEAL